MLKEIIIWRLGRLKQAAVESGIIGAVEMHFHGIPRKEFEDAIACIDTFEKAGTGVQVTPFLICHILLD